MSNPTDSAEEPRVLLVDPERPEREAIERAAAFIRAGELVAFPTETVYGLGGSAFDERAIERIYRAKGRPAYNPLIVHVLDVAGAERVARSLSSRARRLIDRYWPGPLTLVLERRDDVPAMVSAGLETIAVRSPAHPVARALLEAAKVPIAAPSANRAGAVSPTAAAHVVSSLAGNVKLVLDAGPCPVGLESTVLDLSAEVARVLRPGTVTTAQLAETLRAPVDDEPIELDPARAASASPGTSRRHYAPRACVEVVPKSYIAWRVSDLKEQGVAFRVITRGPAPSGATGLALPEDATGFGQALYAALHTLDETGIARIVVEAPPHDDDTWAAVSDRLARAAALPDP